MTTFLRVVACGAGVLVAYAMMGLGGWWNVPGLALFVGSVGLLPGWGE